MHFLLTTLLSSGESSYKNLRHDDRNLEGKEMTTSTSDEDLPVVNSAPKTTKFTVNTMRNLLLSSKMTVVAMQLKEMMSKILDLDICQFVSLIVCLQLLPLLCVWECVAYMYPVGII